MRAGKTIENEQVDELGIPIRVHYHLVAMFAFAVGAAPMAISFLPHGETLATTTLRGLCAASMVLAPLVLWIGKKLDHRYSETFYHAVGFWGTGALAFAAQHTGDLRGALLNSMIVVPIAITYFLPARKSWPHSIFGTVAIVVAALNSNEPDTALRAVSMGLVVFGGCMLMMFTKQQIGRALVANRELSEIDPLTGCANLRVFDTRLADDIARADRCETRFALIQLDLDEFKDVNDRFSHTLGDQVLIATADAIGGELTEADLLVRRGGDEFLIIAPQIDGRPVEGLVNRIADAIADARRETCPQITPTASVAYVVHERGETAAELVGRADNELHDVKVAGRKRRSAGAQAADSSDGALKQELLWRVGPRRESAHRKTAETVRDPIVAATAFGWKCATAFSVSAYLGLAAVTISGATSLPITPWTVTIFTVGLTVLAPFCWWMSQRRDQSEARAVLLSAGTIVLIVAGGAAMGPASVAAIDIALLAIFIQAYLLPVRWAVGFITIFYLAMGAFMFGHGYDETVIRWATTISNTNSVAFLLILARRKTIELAAANAALARTDALTGLPNLRRFRDRLTDEIRRCTFTPDGGFAVLMIDLDDFKSVNDLHSHSLGDKVLIGVADALESTVRAAEMPARRGGDEFAVVLTEADDSAAAATAHRVSAAIAEARAEICPSVTPTASVGWAIWQRGEGVDDLLLRADAALHDVKSRTHSVRGASLREATAASA